MNTRRRISVLLVSILIVLGGYTGCSSTKPASNNNSDTPGNNYGYTNILEMLRKEPALQIVGSNSNPSITVTGAGRSINSSNEPLFVVDGNPVGQGYNNVRHIDVNLVESIDVISGARAGKYGARGAMGVIEIKTKTSR